MTIPNLPTDNLYKFIALTGSILFLFCWVYPLSRIEKIENERMLLAKDIARIEIEQKVLLENSNELNENLELLKKEMYETYGNIDSLRKIDPIRIDIYKFKEKLKNKDYREYLKFTYDYEKQLYPEIKKVEEFNKTMNEIKNKTNELRINSVELSSKHMQLCEKVRQEKSWNKLSVIGIILGIIISGCGFTLWYYKVQLPLDIELRQKISLENKSVDKKQRK